MSNPPTSTISTCLCGAITLTLPKPPSHYETRLCFCTHCAKNSSSTHQLNIIVPKTEVTISDPQKLLTEYSFDPKTTDSGMQKQKFFCSKCGVNMYVTVDVAKELIVVKGGAVDQRNELQPPVWTQYGRNLPVWMREGHFGKITADE